LYQNSPKKSQELTSIVDDLKDVLNLPRGGALPVRCHGSRVVLEDYSTDHRSNCQTSTLDDLLEINLEGPSIKDFSSATAVELWWQDRMLRPNQSSTIATKSGGSAKHQDLELESCTYLSWSVVGWSFPL